MTVSEKSDAVVLFFGVYDNGTVTLKKYFAPSLGLVLTKMNSKSGYFVPKNL